MSSNALRRDAAVYVHHTFNPMSLNPDAFPHVFEEIIKSLYDNDAVDALVDLRVVSKTLRDLVDRQLSYHMVVRRGKIYTYLGFIWPPEWEEGNPHTKRVDVFDYYPRPVGFESAPPSNRSETSEDMSDVEREVDGYSPAPMLEPELPANLVYSVSTGVVDDAIQSTRGEMQGHGEDHAADMDAADAQSQLSWEPTEPTAWEPPRRLFFSPDPGMGLLEVAEASKMWAANSFMRNSKPEVVRCLEGQDYEVQRCKPLDMLSISLADIAEEQPLAWGATEWVQINPKARRNIFAAIYHEGYGLQARIGFDFNDERMSDEDELEVTFLFAVDAQPTTCLLSTRPSRLMLRLTG